MKFLLKKDLPGIKAGKEFIENYFQPTYSCYEIDGVLLVGPQFALDNPDFFEPIVEKKRYEDLKEGDGAFYILYDGTIGNSLFSMKDSRSGTFLTREEAEDEHKRREWACRKDKFIPGFLESYYCPYKQKRMMQNDPDDFLIINSGLAFRTEEDCEKAIEEHDLTRLFFTTIR